MSKRKQSRKHSPESKPKELPGISLEKTVARIQQMMDNNSVVTHNEKLTDRVGIERQIDVVIRGTFGGRPILGVIECKDHSRKKGLAEIEAFAKKTENLIANVKLMVSKKGFTKSALKLAEHEGIGCLSVLPDNPKLAGFSIGDMWYGRLYTWKIDQMVINFTGDKPESGTFDIDSVKYSGIPVLRWFLKELHTTYLKEKTVGNNTLINIFDLPRIIEINGGKYEAVSIAVVATRECVKKRKWINWSGTALYDWHKSTITIPPSGAVSSPVVNNDLATWDDYDGEIPQLDQDEAKGLLILVCDGYYKWNSNVEVIDLSNL